MIDESSYNTRYTHIPKTMSEAMALQLMFGTPIITDAWDGTPNTEIRKWLNENLEVLSKEGVISLNKTLFRAQVMGDFRLSRLFSDHSSSHPLYTFQVLLSVSREITGGKVRHISLYVSSSESDNQFIISFVRFKQCFGL